MEHHFFVVCDCITADVLDQLRIDVRGGRSFREEETSTEKKQCGGYLVSGRHKARICMSPSFKDNNFISYCIYTPCV